MPVIRLRLFLPLAALGLAAAILLWPTPVEAQCGTQASSCKNCHEVQAQDPVNAEGDWHTQHAFGDFCEFCHAGNVTATDKDAAHQGMVYPLGDVKANCSACHAADYMDKAQIYAKTLGVEVGGGAAPAATQEATLAATQETAPAAGGETATPSEEAEPAQPQENAANAGGQIVDLNQGYANKAVASAAPLNIGNVILVILLVILLGAFAVLIWHFEGLGAKWAALRGKPLQPVYAGHAGVAPLSPTLDSLRPALEQASPATLAALSKLLESDPQRGGQMIEALARINPRLVEAVRRLSNSDLELLVALVRDLKERE